MLDRDLPEHLKFGYKHVMEMRELRDAICAERGLDPCVFNSEVYFEATRRYETRHANDPSLRERQEIARAAGAKWVSPKPGASNALTAEEIEYLVDRLSGVNDPTGAAARDKLVAMLPHSPIVTFRGE